MEKSSKSENSIIFPINEMIMTNFDINKKMQNGERVDLSKIPITQIIQPGFDKCKHCNACTYQRYNGDSGTYICSLIKERIAQNIAICRFDGELFSKVLHSDEPIKTFEETFGIHKQEREDTQIILYSINRFMIDNYFGITRNDAEIKTIKMKLKRPDASKNSKVKNVSKVLRDVIDTDIAISMDKLIYHKYAETGLDIGNDSPKYYDLLTIPIDSDIGYAKITSKNLNYVEVELSMKIYKILQPYLNELIIVPNIDQIDRYYDKDTETYHATAVAVAGYNLTLKKVFSR